MITNQQSKPYIVFGINGTTTISQDAEYNVPVCHPYNCLKLHEVVQAVLH